METQIRVADYQQFVLRTDQSKSRVAGDRRAIAFYGLVGEIGSLLSAVKKKLLAEGGEVSWDQPNEEIKEELGDVLWYCFALAQILNDGPFDLCVSDIALLCIEIGANNERAEKIRAILDPEAREAFLAAGRTFPPSPEYSFRDYQALAFKTARTEGRTLLEVCLAVLTQLAGELLRPTLPEIELALNHNIADRPSNTVLGEIVWHISALASIYDLSLDAVVAFNQEKVGFRADRGAPTRLHDHDRPAGEQLPRSFEVSFVRVGPRKSRMYFEGHRLGDDLTDNVVEEDGYRFHDVMHLALIGHLGWSPVVRGMMKRKRPAVDEVEDGGRAKVVEELVIKAIHSEGERLARESGRCPIDGPARLFPQRSTIPFALLKTLRLWVADLEVSKNVYWEWEDAICAGCDLYYQLRTHKQGTVAVDMIERRVRFLSTLSPKVTGSMVGFGMASVGADSGAELLSGSELKVATDQNLVSQTAAAKLALLRALDLADGDHFQLEVELLAGGQLSVRSRSEVQDRIWKLRAVDFKAAITTLGDGHIVCSAMAIADEVLQLK